MAKKPMVSVLCLTYNQKDFIKQCLDGFLMQKTDFNFEVLINDDASTDGTKEILQDYQKRFPDIIKPVFHDKNLYSQGVRGMIGNFLLPKAQGKYLALCEGDDYWTDPNKLQIQVDFLEEHPDYSLCFHKVKVVYDNGEKEDQIYPDVADQSWYTKEELLRVNYIQTNSVMYRKQKQETMPDDIMPGDWYMHLYHAYFGKIKLIDKVMSVYRKHPGGIWWDYDVDRDKLWRRYGIDHLAMWVAVAKLYGDKEKYKRAINSQIYKMFNTLIDVSQKYGEPNLKEVLSRFGEHLEPAIVQQHIELQELHAAMAAMEAEITQQRAEIGKIHDEVALKSQEITILRASRVWRLRNLLARLLGRPVI